MGLADAGSSQDLARGFDTIVSQFFHFLFV